MSLTPNIVSSEKSIVGQSIMAHPSSPTVDAVSLEDLNILLSDLDLANVNASSNSGSGGGGFDPEQGGFTEQGVEPGGRQETAFAHSSDVVLEQVRSLERALLFSRSGEGRESSERDVVGAAIARGMSSPAGTSDGPTARIEALSFMCSELQVLSMEAHRVLQRQRRQEVEEEDVSAARRVLACRAGECKASDERVRALAVISALQRVLQVPEQHAVSSWGSVAQAMLAIAAKAEGTLPPPAGAIAGSGNPQVLLLAGLELTNAQRQTADRVHTAVAADFALRRRMLLRRCDVTVQSFLRGKQRAGSGVAVVDLPPVLKAKRQALSEDPRPFTVGDALTAPRSVAWQHSKKMTEGSGTSKTATKMAEIDQVPNRGGRVGEARAGPAMPAWTARKEFDGGRGGRSGGHRGGRGGGKRDGRGGGGGHRGGGGGGGGGARGGGDGGGGGRRGQARDKKKRKRGGHRGDHSPG